MDWTKNTKEIERTKKRRERVRERERKREREREADVSRLRLERKMLKGFFLSFFFSLSFTSNLAFTGDDKRLQIVSGSGLRSRGLS